MTISAFVRGSLTALSACLLLACSACATRSPTSAAEAPQSATGAPQSATGAAQAGTAHLPVLRREDTLWLERVTFGLDSATVDEYLRLGRDRFLAAQLRPVDRPLPAPMAATIASMQITRVDARAILADVGASNKAIAALPEGADRELARKPLNEQGNEFAYEAIRRDLLRAVYSRSQLQEQMIWFWLNHFSIYQHKANVRWLLGDYEERAIRPHALGSFKDLVLATLEHPAMLQYLDNQQNARGHVNENYARELLELHTLGVNGGYSQADVQQLALVLTGVGINAGEAPQLKPELRAFYRRQGAFEFNPARHDFGEKTLFGVRVPGQGFAEVENAVALIVARPECARFIARELATYFVADNPPPALVARMAHTFQQTGGDIAAVLRTLFTAREFDASLGEKFKDPMRFVVSSVRFAYDGRPISNVKPMLNWLGSLGEAPYGRQTPDGYPMTELNWASSGQLSRRFEIARAIGSGNAGLFDAEQGATAVATGFPQLSNRLYFEAVEPFLLVKTRDALGRANSQQEWNTFLLSSPEFSYE